MEINPVKISDWSVEDNYFQVPNDWRVVIADITDSTSAISEGRYKEVNILGAACIISVTNEIGEDFTHSVFGGDGATFLVAPEHLSQVESVLNALSDLAIKSMRLQMRVGSIAVSELRELGSDVRMAKESMSAGFGVSLFIGGGVMLADQLIKRYPDRYIAERMDKIPLKIEGLECRWNDVPSTRGKMMTLLVKPVSSNLRNLREVFLAIENLLPESQPIRQLNLPFTYPPKHLWSEVKIKTSNPVLRCLHYVGIFITTGLVGKLLKRDAFNPEKTIGKYCLSIFDNTDHVKMDDVFRVVLDVTNEEAHSLELILEEKKRLKILEYGIHYSSSALMTCFVRTLKHHMHFIDGADGGYSAASSHLS